MSCRTLQLSLLSATLLFGATGCSTDTSKGTLDGTVTLDGSPLESGLIRFVPVDGQSPTADATITHGKFSAQVPVGEKRVSISAPKVVGKRKAYQTPDSPTVDIIEELLPARYNAQSELTISVGAGEQPANFELKSSK